LAVSSSKRIIGTKGYYNVVRSVAFPRSANTIVLTSLLFATVGIGTSFVVARGSALSFFEGASWGIAILVLPSFVSNILLYPVIMKQDPLFYLRRCLAFSLFTVSTWVIVFLGSSILALVVPDFVFPGFAVIVGLFAVMPIRSLVVFAMSKTSFARRMLFTLTEPTLTAVSAILVFGTVAGGVIVGLMLSSLMGLAFAFIIITVVELDGRRTVGFSPVRMFRALLTDLLESKNEELESYLNELGVETEISAAELVFRRKSDHRIKGVMLVSNFHPGPFQNIGSSVMPFLFHALIEKRFGAIGVVPHGVSGHELNLVSQEQDARLIAWAMANLDKAVSAERVTPVVRVSNDIATATSQVFDGCALVTMTTAPRDMEDIPSEVASRLTGLVQGRFRNLALIDAHNCLGHETILTHEQTGALEEMALSALQSVATCSSTLFRMGVARNVPRPFTLKDGFGPGGIVVIGIEADGQRFAYIIIDGNNMIRGLREHILATAREVGFEDAEVMTTDTHMVNGIVSAPLGYHTVGEAVPWSALLSEISTTCRQAMTDLEPSEVGAVSGQITVTTLGPKALKRVMGLVYRSAKLTALTVFPMVVAVAILVLVFLV
jgi:putative membrane protein